MEHFSAPRLASAEDTNGLVASFTTHYGDSSDGRKHNIALAARLIDGTVILPEDEFSFNDTVGARTEERGFRTAYVIQDGEYVEGTGGGVCQVSTTLYNCALLAGLVVTRSRPHSLPVGYVAPSFDAMVSSESDLRFANILPAPITLRMYADGNYLRAEIRGVPSGISVRRRSVTLETLPAKTTYIDDPTLPAGSETVESTGRNGLRSEGWLEFSRDGKALAAVRIRRDCYLPQTRVIRRGTALPQENQENIAGEGVTPSRFHTFYYKNAPEAAGTTAAFGAILYKK